MVQDSHSEQPADGLDGALRAAFGASATWQPGVVETLQHTIGIRPGVLLREPAEDAPLVRPHPASDAVPSGRYRIMGEIARGGVGIVLRGHDADLGRDIAMKVLRDDHAASPAIIQRFVEEAQIAGQLQHPGILPVYELGLGAARRPYFTMKLVRGQTLAALLNDRSGPADQRQHVVGVFLQVCQAMAYAHARGVIHRDLKPSNIMVGAFGEVQIVDWGLAKVLVRGGIGDDPSATRMSPDELIRTVRDGSVGSASVAGSVMGTPAYMPPEQARGEVDALTERADVFSLGAILCEILTGRPPYAGAAAQALSRAAAADLADAVQRLAGCGADQELIDLAQVCLAPIAEQRLRDAGGVARTVGAYLESLETRAQAAQVAAAESAVRATQERRARRLTLALALTLGAALIGIGGGTWAWQAQRARRQADAERVAQRVIDDAHVLLGTVRAAPLGDGAVLENLRGIAAELQEIATASAVGGATRARAGELQAELERLATQRHLVERIENAVIFGATHYDRASWERMDADLRSAFADYGLDLWDDPVDAIVARVRASDFPAEITAGIELWFGTAGSLMGMGPTPYTREQLESRMVILYQADPDPFRTRVRRLIWEGHDASGVMYPDRVIAEMRALADTPAFAEAQPRTLSWLAMAAAFDASGQRDTSVYERAILLHPDDFMLNWDYAFTLQILGRWDQAVLYYHRCVALRPDVAGAWRSLGVAHRHLGELAASRDTLTRAIALQPDHAPTIADLGATLAAGGDHAAAVVQYRAALDRDPELAIAHGLLGQSLQALGDLDAALLALEECQRLARAIPDWHWASDEWLADCRAALAERDAAGRSDD